MQPHESLDADLEFLAFRFIAGEMTPPEALAFEGRLADDQLARDAICRAMALAERLSAAASQEAESSEYARATSSQPGSTPRKAFALSAMRAVGWMSAGAAAALLAVYLAPGVISTPPGSIRAGRPGEADRSGQASRPSQVRQHDALSSADALVWSRLQSASQWPEAQTEHLPNGLDSLPEEGLDLRPPFTLSNWASAAQSLKRDKP